MRSVLVAASLAAAALIATPARAADAPPPPAKKGAVTVHYPTLEKMLRRFSRQAGEARTRG